MNHTPIAPCIRPGRMPGMMLCVLMLGGLLVGSGTSASAQEPPTVTVGPRWDAVWVSPRLSNNWVVLRYTSTFPKDKTPSGDLFIELADGVTLIGAYGAKPEATALPGGDTRYAMRSVRLHDNQVYYLYVATTLKPGATVAGKMWAEWKDGKSAVKEFPVHVIDVPVARQPKEMMTGAAIWPYMIDDWPDFVKQYASLGMNQMDLWHAIIRMGDWREKGQPRLESLPPTQVQESAAAGQGDLAATLIGWVSNLVKTSRRNGISVAVDSSTFWEHDILEKDPDAQAIFAGGQKGGPCPSCRGPAFTEAVKRMLAVTEAGVSYIMSDEEEYGNGGYTTACVCPRCDARWKEWLRANRPGLAYISPKDVITQHGAAPKVAAFDKLEQGQQGAEAVQAGNALIEEQYRAWLYFRAALTTERYQYFKQELEKAVARSGAKSSAKPLVGWWAGAADDYTLLVCMQDGRALAGAIDQVIPQLYFRYGVPPRRFRDLVRRQCWALNGKNTYAGIDTDATPDSNVPGNLTAAVLETMFAGGKGYQLWYGPYMDTRQWAELAAVNDLIARYEHTLLHGKETDLFRIFAPEGKGDYFHPWSQDVFAATRETDAQGLLLISDYRAERMPVWVERSLKYPGPMVLKDAATGETVVSLTAGQWDFRIHLKDAPVRLLVWER